MSNPDGSQTDDEAGRERPGQPEAGARPAGPTGPRSPVPAWRKVLWVVAVLYALFLIITPFIR